MRTVTRGSGAVGAGYESRLWEKATCKAVDDPRELVVNPEVQIEQILRESADLREQTERLQGSDSR